MPFKNPIVAGTALVRTAIRSPNYAAGSAGWTINQDGSAEFNNLTARGELDVGPASPNPRTVITSTIPAPLVNASTDFTWTAVQIMYYNATEFEFKAIGTFHPSGNPIYAEGTYDGTNGVIFDVFKQDTGGLNPRVFFGTNSYNSAVLSWLYRKSQISIGDGTQAAHSRNTTMSVNQDGFFQLLTGGDFLAQEPLNYSVDGVTAETWHAMTLLNGWTNFGGFVAAKYKRTPLNTVHIVGVIAPGTKTDGTIIATLPAGYQPISVVRSPIAQDGAAATNQRMDVDTAGNLKVFGVNLAGLAAVEFNTQIPLDA